jgi:hypothetical protein
MHLVDDDGMPMNADYHGEPDEPYIALILESRSGRPGAQPDRNEAYDQVLDILLARLGMLDARLMDALVDSRHTQRLGIPEAERRLIESPIPLALVADVGALRRDMGRKQERIARVSEVFKGGDRHKRIRLRVDVPGYQPEDTARLADRLAEAEEDTAAKHVRLGWTREEVILAMDLYVATGAFDGGSIRGQRSDEVVQLSRLLKELNAYPKELQGERYRSPNGVNLKLRNLRAIQTEGARGMPGYSRLDEAIWDEFAEDLPRLHEEAAAICTQLREGVIQPAKMWPTMEDVDIEQQHTETYVVNPSGEQRAAERAENELVVRYRDYMAAKGIEVGRKRYWPEGEVRPIYSDAWVEDWHALIEAKSSDSRNLIRQAIGQLYDYRRFHQPPIRLVVLLPYQPKAERLDLLRSAGIEAIWRHKAGFRDSADGEFV